MRRTTIIATLAFLAGAAASYYGVPRPVTEKVVTEVAERVIPKEAEQTATGQTVTCRSEGWAVDIPSGKLTTTHRNECATALADAKRLLEQARATLHEARRTLDVDRAYYRALAREGLHPVTEHRARP